MKYQYVFVICLSLIVSVLLVHGQDAYATQTTTKYPILWVGWSETCQRLLENHMNTTCPGLNLIQKYDTSNQMVSGKFITLNGTTIRTNPEFKNHWLVYHSMTVCVLCDLDLAHPDLFKTIFIEPPGFVYINKLENSTNHKFNSYLDRYVSPDCMTSTVGYSDKLLNDTISYILSNCTKTFIQTNQTNTIKDTPFQYDNPYSTLHYQKQISDFKKNGIQNCITKKCDPVIDPYKKVKWG